MVLDEFVIFVTKCVQNLYSQVYTGFNHVTDGAIAF
jgi:hypothetical protein